MTQPSFIPADPDKVENRITVLVITAQSADHLELGRILSHSRWTVDWAQTVRQATKLLRQQPVSTILCDRELPDGDWRDVLRETEFQPGGPELIVIAAEPADSLWAEVLNIGGYDILSRPFLPAEVIRVVSMAWRRWRHRADQPGAFREASRTA